jgi:hypothetical protein
MHIIKWHSEIPGATLYFVHIIFHYTGALMRDLLALHLGVRLTLQHITLFCAQKSSVFHAAPFYWYYNNSVFQLRCLHLSCQKN